MSRRGSEGYALRLSAVEEDILTLLVGRELYGLAMLEASKSAVGGTRALRPGSLYTALYKMEQKGLVRSWWGSETPADAGMPAGAITPRRAWALRCSRPPSCGVTSWRSGSRPEEGGA